MRVAIIVHEFGKTNGHGGIATYAMNRTKKLVSQGFDLILICFESSFEKSQAHLFKEVCFIPRGLTSLEIARWLTGKLEDISPDFLEISDYQGWLCDYLIKGKLGLTKKQAFSEVRHHTATREIYEWNNFEDVNYAPVVTRVIHQQEIQQQRLSDKNTFPSRFLLNYLNQFEVTENSSIEAYPFELSMHMREGVKNSNNGIFNIVSLGRLEKRKGLIHLIDALNKFDEPFTLTIVGNTLYESSGESYRRILSNSMNDALLQKTHFIDFLDKGKFTKLFNKADLFVLPSPFENFPYTAIEAIQHHVPVIASEFSGLADFLDDEFLFNPFEGGNLLNRIRRAYLIWRNGALQAKSEEQFNRLQEYVFNNSGSKPTMRTTSRIHSIIKTWSVTNKFPELNPADSLLVTGVTDLGEFSSLSKISPDAQNFIVALTSESEIFTDLDSVIQREIPFLIPLLQKGEIERILQDNLLGILAVLMERKLVVSMTSTLSRKATGLRFDLFSQDKINFLRSRSGTQ